MPDPILTTSLPWLGKDTWITILALADIPSAARFRDVSRAARELADDEMLWTEIWFARYHADIYGVECERSEDSLADGRWLLMDLTQVSKASRENMERHAPGGTWRSWKEKVLWRAALSRCGATGPDSGCGRLYPTDGRARSADFESRNPQICSPCSKVSGIISWMQGFQVDHRAETPDNGDHDG